MTRDDERRPGRRRRGARPAGRHPGRARAERSSPTRGTDPHEAGVSTGPGDGALERTEAIKDEVTRRWDDVSPAATRIGRPADPGDDVSERLRRLHDERHPAMAGHAERMHRLEKVRITHALCSTLSVTPWERDRALGLMTDLDLTEFGSQRAVGKVALVVLRFVVDEERREQLGLHDPERVRDLSPEEMEALYGAFDSLTDEERFRDLMAERDLDVTSVNRLTDIVREQAREGGFADAVFGRDPSRDPNLPSRDLLGDAATGAD